MIVSAPLLGELSQGRNSGQLRGQWDGHWVTVEALKGEGIWQDPVDTENQSGEKCPGGYQVGQDVGPRAQNTVPVDCEV